MVVWYSRLSLCVFTVMLDVMVCCCSVPVRACKCSYQYIQYAGTTSTRQGLLFVLLDYVVQYDHPQCPGLVKICCKKERDNRCKIP